MNHENGETNGNGNGHEKPFILARQKTPEELRREAVRKQMPEFRRSVSVVRMLAQAKWLFGQITDDSFMFDFGGDGFGTLYTTIKDLAKRYQHDRDSVSKWLAILERKEAVWLEWDHPFCIIHISQAVPPPQHKASMIQRMKARAGSARFSRAEVVGGPFFRPPEGEPALKAQQNRIMSGDVPASRAEDTRMTCGNLPHGVRKVSVENDRQLPHTPPLTPADRAGTCPQTMRASSARPAEGSGISPRNSSSGPGPKPPLERSPSMESQKLKKGEPPPPKIPKFERLDAGMWPKDRLKVGSQMIETLKEKIHALDNTRTPVKNSAEIIAAYRARIKEIKGWMVQEVAA
jgi:hypothetical protein